MKKSLNFLALAAAAAVLLSLPSVAKAQITVRGPHGSFSIGGGAFLPEVGAYVPSPYDDEIYENGDDGYGFYYNSEWIPCTRYGSSWVIVDRPVVYGGGGYGYARPYGYGHSYGYGRPYGYGHSYGYGRSYGYGYVRPYGGYGRRDGFVGRRGFEGRHEFQGQGRSQFQGQGRSQFQGQQDRGSRGNGNWQGNRDGRRGSDRRE